MKTQVIRRTALLLLAVSLLCSCASSEGDSPKSTFSLRELYENDALKLRFSGAKQKDEHVLTNEKVSERWRTDLILKSELMQGCDSLF